MLNGWGREGNAVTRYPLRAVGGPPHDVLPGALEGRGR